jgi:hypothetical protein
VSLDSQSLDISSLGSSCKVAQNVIDSIRDVVVAQYHHATAWYYRLVVWASGRDWHR